VARAKIKLERESAGQALSKQQVLDICYLVFFCVHYVPSEVSPLLSLLLVLLLML
jgi:hypothetical protein